MAASANRWVSPGEGSSIATFDVRACRARVARGHSRHAVASMLYEPALRGRTHRSLRPPGWSIQHCEGERIATGLGLPVFQSRTASGIGQLRWELADCGRWRRTAMCTVANCNGRTKQCSPEDGRGETAGTRGEIEDMTGLGAGGGRRSGTGLAVAPTIRASTQGPRVQAPRSSSSLELPDYKRRFRAAWPHEGGGRFPFLALYSKRRRVHREQVVHGRVWFHSTGLHGSA